jgi:solute:Na+ symporter, SSS family
MLALCTFVFFTALVAVLTWWWTRHDDHHTNDGYFLAGRSLGAIVIAGSLLLTNLSTEQLVGLNGDGYSFGMVVMAWEIFAAVAMVAMALIFLPRYLRTGITTVPEFLEQRYGRGIRIFASILMLLTLLTNLMPFVLYSGALAMTGFFDLNEAFGWSKMESIVAMTIALGVVGGIYAVYGGLKAVAVSDTLNGILLLVGGLAIPIFGLVRLGQGSFLAGCQYLIDHKPEMLNPIGGPKSEIPWPTLFTGMILLHLFYWCTNQVIVQRTFAARTLRDGQKGVLLAAAFKLLGPFYLVLPGIIAWHLFEGSLEKRDFAYPRLVQEVLPTWMTGFFAAVIFGAILSSFNSGLNSATTLFSLDLYKGWLKPEASEQEQVRVGQWFGLVTGMAAIAMAPFIYYYPGGLFSLMKELSALYNIPLLAVVIVGMTTRRVPPVAAFVALIVGMALFAWFGLGQEYFGLGEKYTIVGYQFHYLHFAGLTFAVMVLLMLLVGLIRPLAKPWYPPDATNDVDLTPWRFALPGGIAVLVLVAGMYALLSRF